MQFDIVHAADFSDPGDGSSSLRAELKAARRLGLRVAVIPFIGSGDGFVRPFDRRTASLVDKLEATWLSGEQVATCDILFAHNPLAFRHMPASAIRIRPKRLVCVTQYPPFDDGWKQIYDLELVERNLERLFGVPVHFAPCCPNIRAQLKSLVGRKPLLLERDFFNMVDLSDWSSGTRLAPRKNATIGRHSPPDPLHWPGCWQTLLAAYPDRAHLTIRSLGEVPPELEGCIGRNWQVLPFAVDAVAEFLSSLDFYIYFHNRRLAAGFRMAVAEAMAMAIPAIVDPAYETLFEDGAIYAEPGKVEPVIDELLSSPAKYRRQSRLARKLVEAKFSFAAYPARMRELCDNLDLPRFPALAGNSSRRGSRIAQTTNADDRAIRRLANKKRVLFVATNGQGLGHITRLMAIAERMTADIEPIFFTRSAGSAIIHRRGHATDYIPWSVNMGVTNETWNKAYAQELLAAIESLDIAAVVFDGTYPFSGLRAIQSVRPDIVWVWIRRGLWVNGQPLDETLAQRFHMVIEPGELAQDEDYGPTSRMPGAAHKVSTILLTDPHAKLDRERASARLGADPSKLTAAIQLGSQRNFDYETLPDLLVKELITHGLQVVRIQNPLARPPDNEWPGVSTCRIYPIAPCLSAIDLMITNASYNSFHECVYGGVPTIFVPNESPEMDDQHLRAAYADAAGLGLRLRAADLGRVSQIVEVALSDDFRTQLRRRSARLNFVNGAIEAARVIEELVFSVRTHLPLHASLPRV